MGMKIEIFKITGLSPLLMNNPACLMNHEGYQGREKGTASKIYVLGSGQLYIPAVHFHWSLRKASRYVRTYTKKKIDSGVFAIESECPLFTKDGKPITTWAIHSQRINICGSHNIQHRPEIPEWACALTLGVDSDLFPSIVSLFNMAGTIGVGDYRPKYGSYKVELVTKGLNSNGAVPWEKKYEKLEEEYSNYKMIAEEHIKGLEATVL